ncbi:hypothetical protein B0H13DRAFT_1915631 [Mycena leptocephala]|nr:hypothetical protein B0H13DRAFT_1915631 [Mycena leptocephala]
MCLGVEGPQPGMFLRISSDCGSPANAYVRIKNPHTEISPLAPPEEVLAANASGMSKRGIIPRAKGYLLGYWKVPLPLPPPLPPPFDAADSNSQMLSHFGGVTQKFSGRRNAE